ncbi:oxidoreductase [Rufibacter radiotolerans]|uniref:Oxidoreductase n=1 Tax=Rufibacter radiotolerans TaxID=1379910 RepID=A0A0H4W7R4_9BACT|nr:oxidoreductase [Rufibacter radiotolerans]AKQ46486.1 oxidoreductase [Rufibacter radiotolerans]
MRETATNKIKVGLIGFGMAGRIFHGPFIQLVDGLELIRIRESREENIQIAHSRYPQAQITAQADDIMNDPAIDLVVVATPNTSHYSLAKQALLAGKHVVVEKPFTTTTQEADELIQLARQQNKILTVYHNRRWDSDFKTVQKVVNTGMLGNLVEYKAHFDRFRPTLKGNTWKEEDTPGSGIVFDLGSHLIDQALVLFGKPNEISADVRIQRPQSPVIDKFEAHLYYDQVTVTLSAGLLVRELSPRYTLHGDQGSFLKYGMDVQEKALNDGLLPHLAPDWGVEPESIWGHLNTEHKGLHFQGKIESETGHYRSFYENVYQAIVGEAPLAVTPEQARDVIRVVELITLSNAEKRRVAFG